MLLAAPWSYFARRRQDCQGDIRRVIWRNKRKSTTRPGKAKPGSPCRTSCVLVRETGKPIAQVARDLGINEGTLGNWVNADKRRRGEGDGALSEDERSGLAWLRKENAELAMERDPRAIRPCGGSTWTGPSFWQLHGS